mmetsp:Transcript_38209/g.89668  ORF Transcript_38209/g.89668 Transcript_38209/m.89668 type:complete len:508 (-) Transcript_38209:24-1547(-)
MAGLGRSTTFAAPAAPKRHLGARRACALVGLSVLAYSLTDIVGCKDNVPADRSDVGGLAFAGLTLQQAPPRSASSKTVLQQSQQPEETTVTVGGKRRFQSLPVRIDDTWYDLGRWRQAHPGGAHFIDYYEGQDATEVMHAFHSEKAMEMMRRMPKLKEEEVQKQNAAPVSATTRAFRKLRARLQKEGWFQRDLWHETKLVGIWAVLFFGGLATAQLGGWKAWLSVIPLALATTQAGWLGHDYAHGVDRWSNAFRMFGPLAAGLGVTWWGDKHNKHHALTNQMGADEDIATAPLLYSWAPHPADDSPMRKVQHWFWPVPFSSMFALWRVATIIDTWKAVRQGRPAAKKEMACLALHWTVVLTLVPLPIVFTFITLSGLVSATIVTATHQSEHLFEEFQPDWVTAQFQSTRDARTRNPFTQWLWGGMQYQLEHHLFPSMPRSKYPKLAPIIEQFAKDNNIPGGYRVSDELDIVKMNVGTYAKVAKSDVGGEDAPRVRDDVLVTGVAYAR